MGNHLKPRNCFVISGLRFTWPLTSNDDSCSMFYSPLVKVKSIQLEQVIECQFSKLNQIPRQILCTWFNELFSHILTCVRHLSTESLRQQCEIFLYVLLLVLDICPLRAWDSSVRFLCIATSLILMSLYFLWLMLHKDRN